MVLKVAPSVLSADFGRMAEEVSAVDKAGADWIHLDVMDGRFVPNLTFGPPLIQALRKATQKPFDVHLMIEEPERYLPEYKSAGGDRLNVHVESTRHLHRTLQKVRELGAAPGAALNPSTPLSAVEHVIHDVDQLLIMTVNPGFSGQAFIETVVPKIRQARELLKTNGVERPVEIVVDGGINAQTARAVERAGASVVVAGHGVFRSPPYAKAISDIRGRQRKLEAQ